MIEKSINSFKNLLINHCCANVIGFTESFKTMLQSFSIALTYFSN